MNIERIKEKLTELFEKHRIVFWNDANTEFEGELPECLPEGVEIIRADKIGQLKPYWCVRGVKYTVLKNSAGDRKRGCTEVGRR